MYKRNQGIQVECYAGYRGEEEPRWFTPGQRRLAVAEILDRWLGPEHRYFKVLGSDDIIYLLRHDVRSGLWELAGSGRDWFPGQT